MQGAINTRNTDILNSSIQGLDQLSLNKAETPVVSEIMAFAHEHFANKAQSPEHQKSITQNLHNLEHELQQIVQSPSFKLLQPGQEKAFAQLVKSTVSGIINPNLLRAKYVTDNPVEYASLVKIATKFLTQPDFKLKFWTAFGGTTDPCLFRAPSYAVAALKSRGIFEAAKADAQKLGLNPGTAQLRFVTAHNAAIKFNKFDDTIFKNAHAICSYVQNYINLTRPEVDPNNIEYLEDDLSVVQGIEARKDILGDVVNDDALIQSLKNMGQAHGGDEGESNSLTYAVAHPYFFGDVLRADGDNHNVASICFGGDPEKKFNDIRRQVTLGVGQHLSQIFTPCTDVARLITITGNKPVYYQSTEKKDNDLSLIEALDNNEAPKYKKSNMKDDYKILRNDVSMRLFNFMHNIQEENLEETCQTLKDKAGNTTKKLFGNEKDKKAYWDTKLSFLNSFEPATNEEKILQQAGIRFFENNNPKAMKNLNKYLTAIEAEVFPIIKDLASTSSPRIQFGKL